MNKEDENKTVIGIIGFGMVGKAIQAGFYVDARFRIFDTNPDLCLNTLEEVCEDSNYIFICVPTPMDYKTGKADLSIVELTVARCMQRISNPDTIVIIKSTIPPGTTENLRNKYKGLRLIFNPEFLTARSARLDFINSSRIILGGDKMDCLKVKELYEKRFKSTPIKITDSTTAEMVKYMANCFFAVKVSLFNEYYDICKKLDIDFNEAVGLTMMDGRIGNSHIDVPGHDDKRGFGGLCFPKDLNALIHRAIELDVSPTVLMAAWEKNLEVREEKDWEEIDGATNKKSNNTSSRTRKKI